ncbi:dTDP-4-dehydrorhamnose reductase [Gammaproteobacteria bacterium]|jgi:dTDP-4-dehydrorhamnose reductase|nr:dTDP-4-dehydrorhamnose reductase [Gammaproteobacteria bacterium]MDC1284650.1 dTDP-4-dehydrorhamnose reductase [Gammaproteobacteria bacterium]
MKILLLGASGQLGTELNRQLPLIAEIKAYTRSELDITDTQAVIETISSFKPNVIVNAAAYTAVDNAEEEKSLAYAINSDAVAVLAQQAAKQGAWLIHYSTDYIFDGEKTAPYTEMDAPNPINVYGASKLAGEEFIAASNCNHFIFRTTWVIGKDGRNFAKTILRLATQRDSLSVISDQYGVPTSPSLITNVTIDAIRAIKQQKAWPSGAYNLAPLGVSTWYEIAQTLIIMAKENGVPLTISAEDILAITTDEYPTPAKRPLNSQLETQKLSQQLSFHLPHWKDDFSAVAAEVIKEY